MSIEDVDYLLKNSDENSIVVFIDSKNRDLNAYPRPSSYVVDFEHPIRNVYGIEILDATIPATAYTVDASTCSIGFSQILNVNGVVIYDTTNPTSFATNIDLLQYCPAFDLVYSAHRNGTMFICTDKAGFDSIAASGSTLVTTTTTNAIFYVQQVECSVNAVNAVNANAVNAFKVVIDQVPYYIQDEYIYNQYIASLTAVDPNWLLCVLPSSKLLVYFEYTYCLDDYALQLTTGFYSSPPYDLIICNTYMSIANGSYTSDFLLLTLQSMFANVDNYNIVLARFSNTFIDQYPNNSVVLHPAFSDNPQAGESTITQLLTWTSKCQYPFVFDMDKTSAKFLMGFSEYAQSSSASHTSSTLTTSLSALSPNESSTLGYTTFSYKENRRLFMSLPLYGLASSQMLTSPGVINLESARYLILRCPEIESHLLGSYANFKYAPGIGLFKLMDSNSMMNLRFDFVNITRKPFHPIGKLPKLTLAFEMQNGNLYDFKGVDHVLLVSIKYYAPRNILNIPRSILNPYYLPNILEYQLKQYGDTIPVRSKLKSIEDVIREQKEYM